MNPQEKKKRRWQQIIKQSQYFGNGNPRRGKKGGAGGGANEKQTNSCLRIPRATGIEDARCIQGQKCWVGLKMNNRLQGN